jgi:hypothetical protein
MCGSARILEDPFPRSINAYLAPYKVQAARKTISVLALIKVNVPDSTYQLESFASASGENRI